jgi:hypothetical protein
MKEVKMSTLELKIVKTDKLIVEYCYLPVVDLSIRFLYRFVQPVPTVWQEGKIRHSLSLIGGFDGTPSISTFALNKWKKLVLEHTTEAELPDEAKWLLEMNSVEVRECKIVRVE